MSDRTKASSARQDLRRILKELPQVLLAAMGVRGDVMAASLSKTHKICGKPNCKCARGEKHVVWQLSWTEDGRRRSMHIRANELTKIQASVGRYRHLRRCRANVLKIASEAAARIDELVEALSVPTPENENRDAESS